VHGVRDTARESPIPKSMSIKRETVSFRFGRPTNRSTTFQDTRRTATATAPIPIRQPAPKGPKCAGVGVVVTMDTNFKVTCPTCSRTFSTQPRFRYLGHQSFLPVHTPVPKVVKKRRRRRGARRPRMPVT